MSEAKINALIDFENSPEFTARERLVIRYAEMLTVTPVEVPDDFFDQLRRQFSDQQLVDLTASIAWENYRARFNHAFGIESAISANFRYPKPALRGCKKMCENYSGPPWADGQGLRVFYTET